MTSALSVQTPLVVEVPEEASAAASADVAVSPLVVSAEANPATASPPAAPTAVPPIRV
ncbi:hypothetical protein OV320_2425 [Actinobacteria bacterium OV320]|nr:hypothetical protein OV320_2425 [Actinobacteria bacterium OV320]